MHLRKDCGLLSPAAAALSLVILWSSPGLCGANPKPVAPAVQRNSAVQFDRDIRPILAENCFPCHGPDENKRKAKLRLDREANATGALPNGDLPIVPGAPKQSKVVERITATDSDDVMPPAKTGKKLSQAQIASIVSWIGAGATWQKHWSFVAPHRPELPKLKRTHWARNAIDRFILARLEQEGLSPSREADTKILLRRLSLDLAGLPPTPEQLRSWSRQGDPVGAAADELLASPHFGERMASEWMDIARYADTHGFNNDVQRSMWRWRDWVIDAFNRNLPYDRFLTEQLAGDLLPSPTLDQQIATGFNRNHGINSEGGIIDEEYRVEYVADRVRTTSIAWMGLTMECARCHDHKFDPIAQKDFYRFFAFFNNIDETGEDGRFANAAPILPAPTRAQQLEMARCRERMQAAAAKMQTLLAAQRWNQELSADPASEPAAIDVANRIVSLDVASWTSGQTEITNRNGGNAFRITGQLTTGLGPLAKPALLLDGNTVLRADSLPKMDSGKNWAFSAWVRRDKSIDAPIFSSANFSVPPSAEQFGEGLQVRVTESGAVDVRLAHRWPAYSIQLRTRDTLAAGQWQHLLVACDGSMAAKGIRIAIDGEECFRDVLHDDLTSKEGFNGTAVLGGSDEKGSAKFEGALSEIELCASTNTFEALAEHSRDLALAWAARTEPGHRTSKQAAEWRGDQLQRNDPAFNALAAEFREARARLLALEANAPNTMVMRELPNVRPTFVLFRGQYDAPRERVEPDVPEFIMPFPKNAPRTRLGLAQWLTDPANPLTARVVVNRFWQTIFGTGIVKTSENFGYQGEVPSHPELLDWLAIDFIQSGWDVKRLLRLMVTSATYRQDSSSTVQLTERDPENRLLAHGPRERLTGEMLRDQALFLSGLLHDEIGGPPVFPYQPTNLYKGIVVAADYPGTSYTESTGPELYRRSIYTFWKRTVPHPSLSTFDVPAREVCLARRPKTNTPLQALATMNDTIQVEAARKLAERMLLQGGNSADQRLGFAFQLATARKPKAAEEKALRSLLDRRLAVYHHDPSAAKAFLSAGASPPNPSLDPAELAGYANLASLILNLDETITRN